MFKATFVTPSEFLHMQENQELSVVTNTSVYLAIGEEFDYELANQ